MSIKSLGADGYMVDVRPKVETGSAFAKSLKRSLKRNSSSAG